MSCTPFIISTIINLGNVIFNVVQLATIRKCKTICSGSYRRNETKRCISNIIASIVSILLTYQLCKTGYEKLAWTVLLLFVLGFIYTSYL